MAAAVAYACDSDDPASSWKPAPNCRSMSRRRFSSRRILRSRLFSQSSHLRRGMVVPSNTAVLSSCAVDFSSPSTRLYCQFRSVKIGQSSPGIKRLRRCRHMSRLRVSLPHQACVIDARHVTPSLLTVSQSHLTPPACQNRRTFGSRAAAPSLVPLAQPTRHGHLNVEK